MQTRILAAITEAGDWIKAADIAAIVGAAGTRAVQVHVAKMRGDGVVIDGGSNGYRVPAPVGIKRPSPKIGACPCGAPITKHSKTGLCRPCVMRRQNQDPVFQAKRLARLAEVAATEQFKAALSRGAVKAAATKKADPVLWAQVQAVSRANGLANMHTLRTPEARAKMGRNMQLTKMAWCPEEYWPLNRKLRETHVLLAERKVLIADQIRRDEKAKAAVAAKAERDRLASLTWEERVAEKLRNGGRIVEKFTPRRLDPDYTLGGVSEMAA